MKGLLEIVTSAPISRDGTVLELYKNKIDILDIEALADDNYRFHIDKNKYFDLSKEEIQRVIKAGQEFLRYDPDDE